MSDLRTTLKKGFKAIGIDVSYLRLPQEFKEQRRLLGSKDAMVIFDVGANRGQTYRRYRNLFPNAEIYLFEPTDGVYESLLKEIGTDQLAHPSRLALSSSVGEQTFYANKSDYTNSLLVPLSFDKRQTSVHDAHFERRGEKKVKTSTIDELMKTKKIGHINILKMDVQGGELEALRGATKTLQERKIDLIYSEVAFLKEYEGQPLFEEIQSFLSEYGYRLHKIYNEAEDDMGKKLQADVIFVRG